MEPGLEERLRAHSAHFQAMVSLIPAQYYTTREEDVQPEGAPLTKKGTRFWHNKKGAAQPTTKSKKSTTRKREGDAELGNNDTDKQFSVEHTRSTSLPDLQMRLRKRLRAVDVKRNTDSNETGQGRRQQRRKPESKGEAKKKEWRLEKKQKRKETVKREREAKQKRTAVATAEVDKADNSPSLLFNRFHFNQSSKMVTKKKDYHTLIVKAEAKQKKMDELMCKDEQRGVAVREKERWSKAVHMARGEKIKDDPTLLRKTVRRLKKTKLSHKWQWKRRVRAEQQRQESRQRTRQQNIRERVDKIKAKKTHQRAKKRGVA